MGLFPDEILSGGLDFQPHVLSAVYTRTQPPATEHLELKSGVTL